MRRRPASLPPTGLAPVVANFGDVGSSPDTRRLDDGRIPLPNAVAASGLAASTSDARRLIEAGSVRIDGAVVKDVKAAFGPGTYVVQVGKAKAARWLLG